MQRRCSNLDASVIVISGNEPSSEIFTSQRKNWNEPKTGKAK